MLLQIIIIHGLQKHCNRAAKSRNVQFTKVVIKNITILKNKNKMKNQMYNTQATTLRQKNIKKGTKTFGLD